jgi:hypothetical protein
LDESNNQTEEEKLNQIEQQKKLDESAKNIEKQRLEQIEQQRILDESDNQTEEEKKVISPITNLDIVNTM